MSPSVRLSVDWSVGLSKIQAQPPMIGALVLLLSPFLSTPNIFVHTRSLIQKQIPFAVVQMYLRIDKRQIGSGIRFARVKQIQAEIYKKHSPFNIFIFLSIFKREATSTDYLTIRSYSYIYFFVLLCLFTKFYLFTNSSYKIYTLF